MPLRLLLAVALLVAACNEGPPPAEPDPPTAEVVAVPESLPMGGERSVMSFFISSVGSGKGGDFGGLAGADAHCQALAKAEGAGDRLWRAYLSTSATATEPAVHARDRIGNGPWYNAAGELVAANRDQLHGDRNRIGKESAFTEKVDTVAGVGDPENRHDILTGSRPDGTALDGFTCRNWTSSGPGRAQVGHHDRMGPSSSWNSAHATTGCSPPDFAATGGAGLIYCFAAD